MKKKINLYAIGNEGNFSYYLFDKKNEVYLSLERLLNEIFDFYLEEFVHENNKKTNVEKYNDLHKRSPINTSNNSRVDIFYGNKKMFVTIHSSLKLRLKFNEKLFKIVNMPKLVQIKSKKNKK